MKLHVHNIVITAVCPLILISSSFPQVPFGKFAYMPGQLYDTNEIMVLLGDNWFVKRSVKQALEIAERRKQSKYFQLLGSYRPHVDMPL